MTSWPSHFSVFRNLRQWRGKELVRLPRISKRQPITLQEYSRLRLRKFENQNHRRRVALFTHLQRNQRWCGSHALVIWPVIALFWWRRGNFQHYHGGYVDSANITRSGRLELDLKTLWGAPRPKFACFLCSTAHKMLCYRSYYMVNARELLQLRDMSRNRHVTYCSVFVFSRLQWHTLLIEPRQSLCERSA